MRRLLWTRPNVSTSAECGMGNAEGGMPGAIASPASGRARFRLIPWLPCPASLAPPASFRIPHSAFRVGVDPLGAAVGPVLLLPDGHDLLQPVDGMAAGLEGLGPVRAADRHGHATSPAPRPPGPGAKPHPPARPARPGFLPDPPHLPLAPPRVGPSVH